MNISELSAPTITLQQTLNPELWDRRDHLHPEIRDHLSQLADEFVQDIGIAQVDDIVLTGSHASYGYSPDSTVIVAVLSPIEDDVRSELLAERVADWQSARSDKICGYPVVVTLANTVVADRGSQYSLTEDRWSHLASRQDFSPDDLPVLALSEAWSHRIANHVDWGEEWRRLSRCAPGSVEHLVANQLNEQVSRLQRQSLGNLPKKTIAPVVYGYGESSDRDKVLAFTKDFAPLPKLTFESRLNSRLGYDPSKPNKILGEWIDKVEEKLLRVGLSFESVYGTSAKDYCTRYKRQQLDKWTLRESRASKEDIVSDLLDYTRVHTNLPKIGSRVNIYQFMIDDVMGTIDINIINKLTVDDVNRTHDSFTTSDQEEWTVGKSDLGATTEVCGWLEANNPNATAFLFLQADHGDDGMQFKGWNIQAVEDSNLFETAFKKWSDVHQRWQRVVEDAEPTPDGVNPTTCMFLNEKEVTPKADVVREFVRMCVDYLEIEKPPKIRLRRDPAWSARNKTFGCYHPGDNTMDLSLADRNVMDICRTLAHELVHCRQNERGELGPDSGQDGSPQENEANSVAGEIMRQWGKQHPEFFAAENIGESSGYIPTKKQARDPRFKMALTQDVRPGATGKEANKLSLVTDTQGHPQIARADGKIEQRLAEALRLFKENDTTIPDWLIDLYDRSLRADHAAGRGASASDKKRATFAAKALVKGIEKFWGEDGWRHGNELAMAHKARHGWDDLDDYLDNSLMEKAPESYTWKARVHIKQKGYNGFIDTTIAAPDMRRARTLIAAMYGVRDSDIGSTTKVK